MKAADGYMLILVGTLAALSAEAATAEAGNPYAKIAARNAFGLKDPPPPASTTPVAPPPPKITLQGIAKVLGRKQVLFKVAMPAKPPQPAGEASKILGEGEREDEIEVLEIDEVAGVIKFNNHGTPETKTLKDDAAKPSVGSVAMVTQPGGVPQPAPVGGGAVMPLPSANQGSAGTGVTTIGGSRGAGMQTIPSRNVRGGYGLPTGGGVAGVNNQGAASGGNTQTAEESIIKLEVEREMNKNAISAGKYPPPPPTPITPQ